MSIRDYEIFRKVQAQSDWGEDFYALVMVLMRNADTDNQAKLREAWPDVWAELEQRYNAPAGLLAGETMRRKVFEEDLPTEEVLERREGGLYVNGKLVRAI